ncbi:MAG TPA: type II secretion system F family protein [Pyrinomonadaceae bacterium]|jgi:tight adherence protein C|nr:type II secretion system F family protein [Pyrinomonadaceae bacterium]
MLIITVSIFVFVTLGVMAAYWLMFRPPSAATERLRRMGDAGGAGGVAPSALPEESQVGALAERMAAPFQKLAPPSAAEARKLQKLLMNAGYRSESGPVIFRALQLISLASFPAFVAFGCAVLGRPLGSAIVYICVAVAIGAYLPRFVLRRLIAGRQLRLRWGLADALDLMVVSIEAGLGLNAALVRVGEELKSVHPDISEEFELTNLEIRVGRERDEALRNLAERAGIDDLKSLVAMLVQADRFGTSISRAVRVYADSLRTKRRQRAEQAAQKAAVKLLMPLALFLFPTLFIVILGPAAINLTDSFSKM